ncbi:MAG: glycosyltransferase family 2 protein [Lachnospiraceae bacterium]
MRKGTGKDMKNRKQLNKPLVSIIVPVYNGEQTIERCLCSIRNQTYTEIEVWLIDDGSTDHTPKILHQYEQADARFHVIKKQNTGVSHSRNIGIQHATGVFLQFVDGDDWLDRRATETLVEAAVVHDCEMVIMDYHRVIKQRIYKKGDIKKQGLLSRQEFAEHMMEAPANFYYGVMWNKFFRTEIVKKEGLQCSEELDWCEDFQFNLEYLQYVDTVYVVTKPLYYYVKTKGSLVDTQVNLRQTIRTKRILFEQYKSLYESIDLYQENKLKIQLFYLAVAKDGVNRRSTEVGKSVKSKRSKIA